MEWSLEPGVIAWLLLAEGLYLRALRVLGRRGVAVRRWQVAAWHAGIALQAIGLLSPIDAARRATCCPRTWRSTC